MFFQLFDRLSVFHSAVLTMAIESIPHRRSEITQGWAWTVRKGESVRDRADLFFVILSFTAKAVPSNEYKYKKKKKLIPEPKNSEWE